MNNTLQYYRGLPLRLMNRDDYQAKRAKCYYINDTSECLWIPNQNLLVDGTINTDKDFMFIFADSKTEDKINKAGFSYTYK